MVKAIFVTCACVAFLAQALVACGDTVSYTASLPSAQTNWSDTASLPQFNSLLGTLTGVEYELASQWKTNAMYENYASVGGTVKIKVWGDVNLEWPAGTIALQLNPSAEYNEPVGAYDGVDDFGGTSGNTLEYLMVKGSVSSGLLTSGLGSYIGVGNLLMPVSANGAYEITATSDFQSIVITSADAEAKITYHYSVPEPGSLLALSVALVGGFGIFGRRRKF